MQGKPSPFVIKRLNDTLDSYSYAFQAATVSKDSVKSAVERKKFAESYGTTLGRLTSAERTAVTKASERWARKEARLRLQMVGVDA